VGLRDVAIPLVALAVACGTNAPEIPPELLEVAESACSLDYPEGPYGTEVGQVAADACFQGWARPTETAHEVDTLTNLSFGRYFDPAGERFELLLVNSAALWCQACLSEHEDLPAHYREFSPRGLVILSALFQDHDGEPAGVSDLTLWVETFETPFPMALDPDYQLGAYAPAASAPLNLLLDARNMRILEKFTGDQSAVLWPLVDGELTRREAE
jgi:hypothetical protein